MTNSNNTPKIKAIIENIESKFDINGNRYSYSVVTNTITGESSSFYMGWGSSEILSLLREATDYNYGDFKEFTESIPIREFNRREKTHVDFHDSNSKEIVKEIKILMGA